MESCVDPLIVIFCSLPVSLSFAVAVRMPFASMSNVHFDLRHTPRGAGRMPSSRNVAQRAIFARQLALALQHLDVDGGLIVFGRGEGFRFARRDRGVALDQLGHHAAESLHSQRERCHIEQNHALDLAGQNPRLNRRSDRDHLIRIDGLVGFLAAGKPPHQRLHGRDARRAADQDHLVDVRAR